MSHRPPISRPVVLLLLATPFLIVLIVGATIYQTYLTTKAAVTAGKFVLRPNSASVEPGARVTLSWGVTNAKGKIVAPGALDRLLKPAEKIELVVKVNAKTTKRFTLAARTSNDGKETVTIPTSISSLIKKGASASFALTAVDKNGKTTGAMTSSSSLALKAAPKEEVASSGGGGGGSGGGGSGGGGGNNDNQQTSIPIGQLTKVCVEAGDQSVHVWYQPRNSTISYRIAGTDTWLSPRKDVLIHADSTTEKAIIFDGGSYLYTKQQDTLPWNTNFELRVNTYPADGNDYRTAYSNISTFNSGAAPTLPKEFSAQPCSFRPLLGLSERPDLSVTSVNTSGSLVAGQKISFSAGVANIATNPSAYAPDSTTDIRLDVNNDGVWDYAFIAALPNGLTPPINSGTSTTVPWPNAWVATAGTHRAQVCADTAFKYTDPNSFVDNSVNDRMLELREDNNCADTTFTVAP